MTTRGRLNGQPRHVKQATIARMQGSAAVFFRIRPITIHRRIAMAERKAWHAADHIGQLSKAKHWFNWQRGYGCIKRQQLQMFVRLAGPGLGPRVVESEPVNLGKRDEERLAIFLRELTSLIFEFSSDEQ